jgi:hypothetical protein
MRGVALGFDDASLVGRLEAAAAVSGYCRGKRRGKARRNVRISAPAQIAENFTQLDAKSVSPMQRLFATWFHPVFRDFTY